MSDDFDDDPFASDETDVANVVGVLCGCLFGYSGRRDAATLCFDDVGCRARDARRWMRTSPEELPPRQRRGFRPRTNDLFAVILICFSSL